MLMNRVRRKLARRRDHPTMQPRGLGEPPAEAADDAELDTLRGELVRELDRRASVDTGSACFRRA